MKIFIYFDNHIKIIIFWQQYFWARKNFECITKLIRMRTEKDCERGESNSMWCGALDSRHRVMSCRVSGLSLCISMYDWTEIGAECPIIYRCSLDMDVRYIFVLHWVRSCVAIIARYYVQYVHFWKVISA